MPTLTASASFTIGTASPAADEISITVLPAAVGGGGKGRLVHPMLGAFDYESAPDQWSGIDTDILIPPVWASSKTLAGTANTLWRGTVRDAVCVETWSAERGIAMAMTQFRMLLAFWQNPPDPANGFIQWWPSYTSAFGFEVILTNLTTGGNGITIDAIAAQGYLVGPVELTLRVVRKL